MTKENIEMNVDIRNVYTGIYSALPNRFTLSVSDSLFTVISLKNYGIP